MTIIGVMDLSIFTDRLAEMFKLRGTDFATVATELHIGKNNFTYWKKNGNIPSGEIIVKLADYLETTPDYLLGRTDEKKPPATQQETLESSLKDLTDEELQDVLDYVRYVKSKRKT